MNRATHFHLITALVWLSAQLAAQAQGTAFTYQGSLNENGEKANGIYRLRLTIHSAETGASVVAGPITNSSVAVVNGLFTTVLDFGPGVFDGNRRWLELGVVTNGAENFVTLSPRQEILPSPYAIAAARLIGPLPSNGLAGAYSEQVTLSNPANVFTGDGGGLTNVQAATLGGLSRTDLWQLGGNSGTSSNSFLGTTDDEPLELKINGQRALRLEPQNGTVNVIAGFSGNMAKLQDDGAQSRGVTISGGGESGAPNVVFPPNPSSDFATIGGGAGNRIIALKYGTISGGYSNTVTGGFSGGDEECCGTIGGGRFNYSADKFGTIGGGQGNALNRRTGHNTIGGGYYNKASGSCGTIGGGLQNTIDGPEISPNSDCSTIGGGAWNFVGQGAPGTTISGGRSNQVLRSHFATIGGGASNTVGTASSYSSIGGGADNFAATAFATIPGGHHNEIATNSPYSAIGGGQSNSVAESSEWSTISGGNDNSIGGIDSDGSTIGGGQMNNIAGHSLVSTIGGGYANIIGANSDGSVIGGGRHNEIASNASRSFIAGGRSNTIDENSSDSSIAGGSGNTIATNSDYGTITGGANNLVTARSSTVPGGRSARTSNYGQMAYASGQFATPGDAQTSVYVCRGSTTNATPTELFLDGALEQIKMPTNSVWTFDILVVAATPDGTSASYQILGAARNNNGITTLAAAPKQNILVEDDPSWNAVPFAAAADNKLAIRVTGSAATSVRWVATIRTTEVIY